MIAHHTLGGCPLRTGDLLGSGTISGQDSCQRGSLLEMTNNGKDKIQLGREFRTFLLDGDTVRLTGLAGKDGARVGFGECVGTVKAAHSLALG